MKLKIISGGSLYETEQLANQFFKEHPLITIINTNYSTEKVEHTIRGLLLNRDLLIFYEESSASNN